MRLGIDTDVGTNPDDAIALAIACRHPDVTLVGVGTVDDADGAREAAARHVLRSNGCDPSIVVNGRDIEPRVLRDVEADALLAIGPLTNVARIVDAGSAPSHVAIMGGALAPVWHRDAWRDIESNFGADPVATARVLATVDVLLVPLDVTATVCLDDSERALLMAHAAWLGDLIERWPHPLCLHDPLAFLALCGEPMFTVEQRSVAVDEAGRVLHDCGRVQHVVTGVDRGAAVARIVALLTGGGH